MLSQRERLLILLLAFVVVAGGVYFAVRSVNSYQSGLAARISAREATLRKARAVSREIGRLENLPQGRKLSEPLIGYVEKLARRQNVSDRVQLNLIPQDKDKEVEVVEIKVDSLTLDQMVGFLHAVESADPPLLIDQLEVSSSYRSKTLLRLTVRVLARK